MTNLRKGMYPRMVRRPTIGEAVHAIYIPTDPLPEDDDDREAEKDEIKKGIAEAFWRFELDSGILFGPLAFRFFPGQVFGLGVVWRYWP